MASIPGDGGSRKKMNISLKHIMFNHDPASAETSALNIRKNEKEPVELPEWRDGVSVSPAAYAIAATDCKTISIKVRFSSTDRPTEPIFVRAVPAAGPASARSLGRVVKTEVCFKGNEETDFISFDLADVKLKELGVGVNNVTWSWQYCVDSCDDPDNLDNQRWVNFATTTHRIYRVIDTPTYPWVQTPFEPGNIHLPWAEVLDYACVWAASAHTADEAARLVTHGVYSLGLAKILTYQGSNNYTGSMFACTALLHQLRGEVKFSKGPAVNCTDCATIVSTFANALGSDLSQSQMGGGFSLNPHLRIGRTAWEGGEFGHHELAWKGGCTENDAVFDACLIVDGDDVPTVAPPQIPLLATNLLFGSLEDKAYRFRLAPGGKQQNCKPRPKTKTRRQIGALWRDGLGLIDEELLTFLAQHYEFDEWPVRHDSPLQVFISNFVLSGNELPGWEFLRPPDSLMASSQSLWQETYWHPVGGGIEVLLRIDTHHCASSEEARQFLLRRLAQYEELNLVRRDGRGVGDVAFADGQDFNLFFTRGDFVCVIRNVGMRPFPVRNVASALNEKLMSGSDSQAIIAPPIPLPDAQHVELKHLIPELASGADSFKIFSDAGEVLVEDGHLIYRPTEAAEQNLTVLVGEGGGIRLLRFLRG